MRPSDLSRRQFNFGSTLAMATGLLPLPVITASAADNPYRGPNVVLIRFGGGVRRRETIEPAESFAPYLLHRLVPRGVLLPNMTIAQLDGVDTSHAEGTINILTGRYRAYEDLSVRLFDQRLRPTVPTLFEALRERNAVAAHEAILINGEDRLSDEFLLKSGHVHTGVTLPGEILSLHQFKLHNLQQQLAEGAATPEGLASIQSELAALLKRGNASVARQQPPAIARFWDRWRDLYGDTGLVNARGDRLLTQLALAAIDHLQPRLMMVCYQDTDYVHWGNASHYTRAIAVIDDGLRQIVEALERHPFYNSDTIVCVVPDCGRDANPLIDVPFQHHFNSRAAHDIWALFVGIGPDSRISKEAVIQDRTDQSAIAPTLAALMDVPLREAEGRVLSAVLR